MNARKIWTAFIVHRLSTAEIARRTGEAECDVDRIIAQCMNGHYYDEPMPFEKEIA